MRHAGLVLGLLVAYFIQGISVMAESTVDVLEKDLNDVKEQHQAATSQVVVNFLDQLDAASRSPDAALALYQQAGGLMPDPTPVVNPDGNERQDAKAARLAQDQDNVTRLANVLQVHCAIMRYGGLLICRPDQKGLQEDWVNWLKNAAQTYPQIRGTEDLRTTAEPDTPSPSEERHHHRKSEEGGRSIGDWKSITVHDSLISKFLNFHAWGDKEQGKWSVKQIPDLYRTAVLEPLRVTPSNDTLAAWDVFIAMKNADQTDADKWAQIDFPTLSFDRACDDYAVTHSMDKLDALVEIIKANPTHPKIDDMINRARDLVKDYRANHSPDATAVQAPATNSADPNVSVSKQGDMTIITTAHTNAPPANPPAPPQ